MSSQKQDQPEANGATTTTAPSETKDESVRALVSLEEDDEFEDFPVEQWNDGDLDPELAEGGERLWEEKWDDDDADDDFAAQLREELRKNSV
ncbi:uncharacterized protein SAPINGB_P004484 [Magnusiomyces paraingens]|uniref:26S proteasome complex subunit SEM1 n=1 Tax=Magnusiomyces paraingens TaxID=2606893 RepID=A0A5E8BWY9_9ASCO|nr:uncharacterized protein SAPINGB_P004484 [Saprochaete ingens]VVT55214.1 unnamed protein product [Saprochaete ingens]